MDEDRELFKILAFKNSNLKYQRQKYNVLELETWENVDMMVKALKYLNLSLHVSLFWPKKQLTTQNSKDLKRNSQKPLIITVFETEKNHGTAWRS